MSSDSEIDDLQRFEALRQHDLAKKAGIAENRFEEVDMSDEEVLGLGSDENEEDEDEDEGNGQDAYYEQDDKSVQAKRARTNREIEDNWGQTRDNYFGGEDDIGDDEGASEEEEQEALRLRQRELEDMDASDFVDEDDLEGWRKGADADDLDAPAQEPSFDISTMTTSERKELIEEKFPAVILLSSQLQKCQEWESELSTSKQQDDILEIGRAALGAYKGMIYAYFALFTDRIQSGDVQGLNRLEDHPVNEGLLMARQLWINFQQISRSQQIPRKFQNVNTGPTASASIGGDKSDPEELSDQSHYEDSRDAFADDYSETSNSDDDNEFAIARPENLRVHKSTPAVGDFDETADTIEQQARAKNKQSLRFYTSQIGKHDLSKQESYSGDIDLPYREREFERRQRLMAEAQKRGQLAEDRLGDYGDDEISAYDENNAENGNDALDLYSQVEAERAAQRAMKMQRHADAIEAAREGRIAQYVNENPNIDKRAINYQIEKNKGLTRKRKKENRNARVKKRVRYEAAQKKLRGVRREYKQPEGPYQGELTGIRKNLTHSTRFKS